MTNGGYFRLIKISFVNGDLKAYISCRIFVEMIIKAEKLFFKNLDIKQGFQCIL